MSCARFLDPLCDATRRDVTCQSETLSALSLSLSSPPSIAGNVPRPPPARPRGNEDILGTGWIGQEGTVARRVGRCGGLMDGLTERRSGAMLFYRRGRRKWKISYRSTN